MAISSVDQALRAFRPRRLASLHPILHHIEKREPEREAAGQYQPHATSEPGGRPHPLKKRKWVREIESRMSVIPPKERPLGRQGALARRQKPNTKT
jgi:hypothetical protein